MHADTLSPMCHIIKNIHHHQDDVDGNEVITKNESVSKTNLHRFHIQSDHS